MTNCNKADPLRGIAATMLSLWLAENKFNLVAVAARILVALDSSIAPNQEDVTVLEAGAIQAEKEWRVA